MPGPVTKLPNGGSLQALYAHPLPNAPGMKLVAVKVMYEPGGWTERHRHGNAFVTAVLLEGSVESAVNDEEPKTYSAGESWTENPGDIHSVSRNASKTEPAAFIASFVFPTEQEEYVIPSHRTIHVMTACLLQPDDGAFAWRGVHLDPSRHFLPLEDVRRMVEALALLKMNVLHFHLSDDQGWRFESREWPRLTEVASKRKHTVVGRPGNYGREDLHPENYLNKYDGKEHGGFYTQKELRELVAFAKGKGVTVVPEIDMPGHMKAARAAYPELGYNGTMQNVGDSWGVYPEVLRVDGPGLQFAKDILGEICDVFDSPYVHIGGDECPKVEWAAAPTARKQVKKLGLDPDHMDSYHELQAAFTRELAHFLASRGRKLVGWDEILDGPSKLDGVAVMAWRDWLGAAKRATDAGIPVVQTPNLLYFDYAQGPENEEPLSIGQGASLQQVYAFDPLKGVDEKKRGLVLGAQAQLWSEYIPDAKQLWYMAFPRLIALADVTYYGDKRVPYDEFLKQLPERVKELEKLGIVGHPLP